MTTSSDQAPGAFAGKVPIRAGFTLVELTIVIAVIGVLLAAVFLLFQAGGRAADRVTHPALVDEIRRIQDLGYLVAG